MLLLWGQIFACAGEVVWGHVRSPAGRVPNPLRTLVLTVDTQEASVLLRTGPPALGPAPDEMLREPA